MEETQKKGQALFDVNFRSLLIENLIWSNGQQSLEIEKDTYSKLLLGMRLINFESFSVAQKSRLAPAC